jgi:hypothetical protein
VDQVHQKAKGNVEKLCKISALVVINVKRTLQIIIDSPLVNKENITTDICYLFYV